MADMDERSTAGDAGRRRTLRRRLFSIGEPMLSNTSGMALLWIGWVVIVYFVVLWLLLPESETSGRAGQVILLMAMLGQCAVVTGVGLALLDTSQRRHGRSGRHRPRPAHHGQAQKTQQPDSQRMAPPRWITLGRDRPVAIHPDGSVDVATRVGWRRFSSTADAAEFVGLRLPRDVGTPATTANAPIPTWNNPR